MSWIKTDHIQALDSLSSEVLPGTFKGFYYGF